MASHSNLESHDSPEGKEVAIKRFWLWLRLNNLRDAFDLAVKFTAIVAGLAALNLFTVKPDLVTEKSCYKRVDIGALRDYYEDFDRSLPRSVLSIAKRNNEVSNSQRASSFFPTNFEGRCAPILTVSFGQAFDLFGILSSEEEASPSARRDARRDARRESFARRALRKSAVPYIEITIANAGQASARNVRLAPPAGSTPVEGPSAPFDLGPSESKSLVARGSPDALDEFSIAQDSVEVIDIRVVTVLGLSLLVLWLFVVGREVLSGRTAVEISQAGDPKK